MEDQELTTGELKKKALAIGMRLKSSGLDPEVIYARLEKEGIPEDIARLAVKDIFVQSKIDFVKNEAEPRVHMGLIRIGLGVLVALLSLIIFPNNVIIPVGAIIGGVGYALYWKFRSEN